MRIIMMCRHQSSVLPLVVCLILVTQLNAANTKPESKDNQTVETELATPFQCETPGTGQSPVQCEANQYCYVAHEVADTFKTRCDSKCANDTMNKCQYTINYWTGTNAAVADKIHRYNTFATYECCCDRHNAASCYSQRKRPKLNCDTWVNRQVSSVTCDLGDYCTVGERMDSPERNRHTTTLTLSCSGQTVYETKNSTEIRKGLSSCFASLSDDTRTCICAENYCNTRKLLDTIVTCPNLPDTRSTHRCPVNQVCTLFTPEGVDNQPGTAFSKCRNETECSDYGTELGHKDKNGVSGKLICCKSTECIIRHILGIPVCFVGKAKAPYYENEFPLVSCKVTEPFCKTTVQHDHDKDSVMVNRSCASSCGNTSLSRECHKDEDCCCNTYECNEPDEALYLLHLTRELDAKSSLRPNQITVSSVTATETATRENKGNEENKDPKNKDKGGGTPCLIGTHHHQPLVIFVPLIWLTIKMH